MARCFASQYGATWMSVLIALLLLSAGLMASLHAMLVSSRSAQDAIQLRHAMSWLDSLVAIRRLAGPDAAMAQSWTASGALQFNNATVTVFRGTAGTDRIALCYLSPLLSATEISAVAGHSAASHQFGQCGNGLAANAATAATAVPGAGSAGNANDAQVCFCRKLQDSDV